ncbi:DUF4767 domain-containing protein [Levilactobacillus bambusae]|uniref:DUF4767 domain-containing protein n=2 Tax=Levilactobacillus bambusae TaxID=2024736 RepID=A0A2V1N022_9LACO|nr:DUF4767 domain-containing protein [Levilactobacillus bambusae]
MDLNQIQDGDYSSLQGKWKLEAAEAQSKDTTNSTPNDFKVTKNEITNGTITLSDAGIKYNGNTEDVTYNQVSSTAGNGFGLEIKTDDQNSNQVCSVEFYPIGTTGGYTLDGEKVNSKNTIVISSNYNSLTEVYVEEETNETTVNASWNAAKDQQLTQFMSQWGQTMDQDYDKYDGRQELKTSTGTEYPSGLTKVTVQGQQASIGWSENGVGKYDYNVVAIYNHDGTKPPLPNHITYFFAFHNGQPIILVDQSRDGTPDLGTTQNAKLKAGFNSIAKS